MSHFSHQHELLINKFQVILSFNISVTGNMSTLLDVILIAKRDMLTSRGLPLSANAGCVVDLGALRWINLTAL